MAKKSGIVPGKAVAFNAASPRPLDAYRAIFSNQWRPYGNSLLQMPPAVKAWRPDMVMGPWPGPGASEVSAARSAPVDLEYTRGVQKEVVFLPPIHVTDYEVGSKTSKPRAVTEPDGPSSNRVSTAAEVLDAPSRASPGTVQSSPVSAARTRSTASSDALATVRESVPAAKLDFLLKGTHTALTANTAEEKASGYLSAVGAPVGTVLGKFIGARTFKGTSGTIASETFGIGLGMLGDKLGIAAGKKLVATSPDAVAQSAPPEQRATAKPGASAEESAQPQSDPYSKMTQSIKDAFTATAIVGTGYVGWEGIKSRFGKVAASAAASDLPKGIASNPVTWLAAEAGAKAIYTAAKATTSEQKWAGYGGAVGGLLLGAGLGYLGSRVPIPGVAVASTALGNFLGDQIGSAVGGFIGATFDSPTTETKAGVSPGPGKPAANASEGGAPKQSASAEVVAGPVGTEQPWPTVIPGISAMPGIVTPRVRFPVSGQLDAPRKERAVPPQSSVLPEPVAPSQASTAVAPSTAGQPISFTTNIPITLQGAAVAHDQLATDLELAVRRVLEERQRADEARLADPLRQF